MGAQALSQGDFAWLVGSLCQLNRVPFDPALLLQRFPAPHSERQCLEALQALGFRTGRVALGKASFPCVAFLRDEGTTPAIIVKCDGSEMLYFVAGSQAAKTCSLSALERFEPHVLLVRHEAAQAIGDDA